MLERERFELGGLEEPAVLRVLEHHLRLLALEQFVHLILGQVVSVLSPHSSGFCQPSDSKPILLVLPTGPSRPPSRRKRPTCRCLSVFRRRRASGFARLSSSPSRRGGGPKVCRPLLSLRETGRQFRARARALVLRPPSEGASDWGAAPSAAGSAPFDSAGSGGG